MKQVIIFCLLAISLNAEVFNISTTPELREALEVSATNGEDDTINIADGIYKTTDDGGGTFIYFSNEDNNLTLIGSSSENVILSGDNLHQILNHNSTEDAPMKVEKLSFIDGNNTTTASPATENNHHSGAVPFPSFQSLGIILIYLCTTSTELEYVASWTLTELV